MPTTATCMSMDFAFFSEEFPEFVGSQFNDTFDAFVDGQPIARDQNGNRISINSVFGATPGNAAGTTYDAATPRLRSRAALTPGATSVITFFVTDVSDTAYDSAVFIDKFTFGRPEGEACVPGANLPVGVVLTKTVGPWPEAGNPVCALYGCDHGGGRDRGRLLLSGDQHRGIHVDDPHLGRRRVRVAVQPDAAGVAAGRDV
ncbi:MAG: choice-of-anchor L domain-containing protein [Anaerolineae bacterium]|nr:choice-of-anchor L domain-containing protein [Anaerolineae bacterium]